MTYTKTLETAVKTNLTGRIWSAADPDVYIDRQALTPKDFEAAEASIASRLGWLEAPEAMRSRTGRLETFARDAAADGLSDIYLLGMGGSSLCAEVVRDTLGSGPNRLVVLDTTDDETVRQVSAALVPERSLFLVASKSGSTVEVTSLEAHFWQLMAGRVANPGRHFVAITDPDTALAAHAAARGYRDTFINPADIGGRFSALSLFGLVPAVLCGVSPAALLEPAVEMTRKCRENDGTNPGLALGVFIGAHAAEGRDKLTLLTSPQLSAFGVWVEQLVAESTGKHGRGALPVVDEPIGPIAEYGTDRAFVVMATERDSALVATADAFEAAGHPVFRIITTPALLGGEFFRWEFATAVAGAVLRVNPFDEPDVRKAKTFTKAQLDAFADHGRFSTSRDFEAGSGDRVRVIGSTHGTPGYVAILDFLPASSDRRAVVSRLRSMLRSRLGVATTHGYGPRYLHSTGQYHKGGPKTGCYLLVTALDSTQTPIPGQPYSFAVLKCAQGFGDFDALEEQGRTVVHVHVDSTTDPDGALERAASALLSRLAP